MKCCKLFGSAAPCPFSNIDLCNKNSSGVRSFFNAKQASTEIIQNNYISSLEEAVLVHGT